MHHRKPGGSPGKSLDLPQRQETIVSGCVRRGDSGNRLNELQRRARATAISSDPRDGHEPLTLLLLPQKILCASAGDYPHPARSLCSMPLPGSHNPGTSSPGEHTVRLRLLQRHVSLYRRSLVPCSNYNYYTPPFPPA